MGRNMTLQTKEAADIDGSGDQDHQINVTAKCRQVAEGFMHLED